jgi:hypothetical protein
MSSSDSLPARALSDAAQLGGQLDDALAVDVTNHRHQQATLGVGGHANVN